MIIGRRGVGSAGSLWDLGRQPFSDTEINLNSFSYQSPIAPEAPNHVAVSGCPPLLVHLEGSSPENPRETLETIPNDRKEEQCPRLNRSSGRAVDILISG